MRCTVPTCHQNNTSNNLLCPPPATRTTRQMTHEVQYLPPDQHPNKIYFPRTTHQLATEVQCTHPPPEQHGNEVHLPREDRLVQRCLPRPRSGPGARRTAVPHLRFNHEHNHEYNNVLIVFCFLYGDGDLLCVHGNAAMHGTCMYRIKRAVVRGRSAPGRVLLRMGRTE